MTSDEILITRIQAWAKTSPAAQRLSQLCQENLIPAYYFGGVCRSCWKGERPRDIDIVVDDLRWDALLRNVEAPFRENRFGGIKFTLDGESVDAWPTSKTWTFANGLVLPDSATKLPETAFLNIEAVVALVWHPESPWVFEKNFFAAMESGVLEIQNPDNPYPALCLARIQKFLNQGWIEGESVRAFRKFHAERGISEEDIRTAHLHHYGHPDDQSH